MDEPDMQQSSGVACALHYQRFQRLRMDVLTESTGLRMEDRHAFAVRLDALRDALLVAMGDPCGLVSRPMRVTGGTNTEPQTHTREAPSMENVPAHSAHGAGPHNAATAAKENREWI
jgi:hypothetical protein